MEQRILLVDDEESIRFLTANTLRDEGYNVIEASDGQEALDKILAQPEPFNLIVTDLRMPRMDGKGLLDHLQGSIPTIVTSGTFAEGGDASTDEVVHLGAVATLRKPYDAEDLLTCVRKYLPRAVPQTL